MPFRLQQYIFHIYGCLDVVFTILEHKRSILWLLIFIYFLIFGMVLPGEDCKHRCFIPMAGFWLLGWHIFKSLLGPKLFNQMWMALCICNILCGSRSHCRHWRLVNTSSHIFHVVDLFCFCADLPRDHTPVRKGNWVDPTKFSLQKPKYFFQTSTRNTKYSTEFNQVWPHITSQFQSQRSW